MLVDARAMHPKAVRELEARERRIDRRLHGIRGVLRRLDAGGLLPTGTGAVGCALIVLLVLAFCSCQTMTGQTLKENIDDARITLAIKTKLAEEKALTLTRIGVETINGTVYLTGIVESDELKQRATEIAQDFEGVRAVVNQLQVKPRQ